MAHLHQAVAMDGGYETLRALEASNDTLFSIEDLTTLMSGCGVGDPPAALGGFVASSLLSRSGEHFGLTTSGIRTSLLLEAINGGDLKDIYRRLARLDVGLRAYELVRQGMTDLFLRNVNERPGFQRLYICSPWISFNRRQEELLFHALLQAERTRGNQPELLIITRPGEGRGDGIPASLARLHGRSRSRDAEKNFLK